MAPAPPAMLEQTWLRLSKSSAPQFPRKSSRAPSGSVLGDVDETMAQADDDAWAEHVPTDVPREQIEQLRAGFKRMIASPWSQTSRPSTSSPRSTPIGATC
jgi:hypothetical protein